MCMVTAGHGWYIKSAMIRTLRCRKIAHSNQGLMPGSGVSTGKADIDHLTLQSGPVASMKMCKMPGIG